MKLKSVIKKANCRVSIKLGDEIRDADTCDWEHKPVSDYEVIDFAIELEEYPTLLLTVQETPQMKHGELEE